MKEIKTLSRNMVQAHFGMLDFLNISPDFEKLVFKRFQNYREITVDELEEIGKKLMQYSNYSSVLEEQYMNIGGITEKEILKHAMIEIFQNCCLVTFID